MRKKTVILIFLLLFVTVGYGQKIGISTLQYVNKFLWKHNQLLEFQLKDQTVETSKEYFYVDLFGSKLFNDETIKVYEMGAREYHAKRYILVEKFDNKKKQSSFIVVGVTVNLNELKVLYKLFKQYTFSALIKNKCYDRLILDSYNADFAGRDGTITIDSLWNREP